MELIPSGLSKFPVFANLPGETPDFGTAWTPEEHLKLFASTAVSQTPR
jgi:hypothetical protein